MNRSERGFTVIELLMALAISALLLTVVYRSFNSVEQSRSQITSGSAAHHAGRVISSRIGRELLSLQFRAGDPESRFYNSLESGVQLLEFSSSASTPLSTRSGMPSRIAYRLRPASGEERGPFVLERSERSVLSIGEARSLRIVDGVGSLSFRFYADGRWQADWDSDQTGELPESVAMTVELQGDDLTFRTAWPLAAFGG